MASMNLGELSVTLSANLQPFLDELKRFQSGIAKVGIDLEKKLGGSTKRTTNITKTQFNELNGQMQKLAKGVTNMSNQFKKETSKLSQASKNYYKNIKSANKGTISSMLSLQSMMQKIVHYITFSIGVQMVMGIRQGITSIIESFRDFERSATNAASVSGFLGAGFEDVRDHIMDVSKELGRTTIFSLNEVADAFYNLASAGYDVSKMTSKDLRPILNYAAATQSDLAEATESAATAMKAFGMDIEDLEEIVDTFTGTITSSFMTFDRLKNAMKYVGPIAGVLGLQIQEISAALASLTDRGMTGSQAGQRLNMIFTKLLKPTDQATELLDSMGISASEINPQIYSLTEILYKLRAANFDAASASTMFRARTAAAAAMLVDSAESISRYNTYLLGTSGITEDVAEKQRETLYGSLIMMSNALKEAGVSLIEDFVPILKELAAFVTDDLVPVLSMIADLLKSLGPILIPLIEAFIAYKVATFAVLGVMKLYNTALTTKLYLMGKEGTLETMLTAIVGKRIMKQKASISSNLVEIATINGLVASKAKENTMRLALASTTAKTLIARKAIIAHMALETATSKGLISSLIKRITLRMAIIKQQILYKINAAGVAAGNVAMATSSGLLTGALAATKAAFASLWAVMAAHPIGMLLIAIGALVGAIYLLGHSADIPTSNLKKLGEVKLGDIAGRLSEMHAIIYELTSSSKSLGESIESVNALDIKDWGPKGPLGDVSDEIKERAKTIYTSYEQIAKGNISLLGVAGMTIPGLTDISNGINDWLIGLLGLKKEQKEWLDVADDQAIAALRIASRFNGTNEEFIKYYRNQTDAVIITQLLASELVNMDNKLEEVKSATDAFEQANKNLKQALDDEKTTVEELLNVQESYVETKERLSEANTELLTSIKLLIKESRNFSSVVDTAANLGEKWADSNKNLIVTNNDLDDSMERQTELSQDYSAAVAQYGYNSKEASDIERKLQDNIIRTSNLREDKAESTADAASYESKLNRIIQDGIYTEKLSYKHLEKMGYTYREISEIANDAGISIDKWIDNQEKQYEITRKITGAEQYLAHATKILISNRENYNDLLNEQARLEAEISALEYTRENITKIRNEQLKRYLEAQSKIYDQELKLYKLRQDEDKQLEDLFNSLAEKGLIDKESIELFKEMKRAEGDILKLNNEYYSSVSKLSDSQREIVTQFMDGAISAEELGNNLSGILSEEEIKNIVDYKNAQTKLSGTLKNFRGELSPFIEDLIDQGVVSSETAEIWYDMADDAEEIVNAEIDMKNAISDTNSALKTAVRTSVTYAKSLMTTSVSAVGGLTDKYRDLFDIYEDGENQGKTVMEVFSKGLGVWDAMGGSIEDVKDTLKSFYGLADDEPITNLTQSQMSNAAALIQMGESVGVWEKGMSGVALSNELGAESFDDLSNYASSTWQSMDTDGITSMADATNNWKGIENDLDEAFSTLKQSINDFRELSEDIPLKLAFESDFTELMEIAYGGNLQDLFKDAFREGIDITAVMTDSWSDSDWNTFAKSVSGDFGESFISDLKSSNISSKLTDSLSITSRGSEWEDLFSGLDESELEEFNRLLNDYRFFANINTLWDNQDWGSWLGEVEGRKKNLKKALEKAEIKLPVDSVWEDEEEFDDWMDNLTGKEIKDLKSELEGANIELPADLDENFVSEGTDAIDRTQQYFNDNEPTSTPILDDHSFKLSVKNTTTNINNEFDKSGKTSGKTFFDHIIGALFGIPTWIIENVIPLVVLAFSGIVSIFGKGPSIISGTVTGLASKVKPMLTNIIDIFGDAGGVIGSSVGTISSTVSTALSGVIDIFGGASSVIGKSLGSGTKALGTFVSDALKGVTSVGDVISRSIGNLATWIKNQLTNILSIGDMVKGNVEGFLGFKLAKGGIAGLQSGITKTKGPMFSMIGEAGAEAVVPLEGSNRKYGLGILKEIIPNYFPELTRVTALQTGGVGGMGSTYNRNEESYNLYGPVSIQPSDVEDFTESMKYKFRMSR
jgi:TP901 family phage tail tape measure protein